MPRYVIHRLPSVRANDPTAPVMPDPAVTSWSPGTVSGGHAVRHTPVQVAAFIESPVWVYSVRPSGPVRKVPREGAVAARTVVPPAIDGATDAAVLAG